VKREFHAGRTGKHFTSIFKAIVLLLFVRAISLGHCRRFDRLIHRSIDRLANRTTAISVPVRFFTPCRFRFSRLDRAFFLGYFRSTVSLCFFLCSFLVSASLVLFFFLLPFFLSASYFIVVFLSKFCLSKKPATRHSQFQNIKALVSLLKEPLSSQSFSSVCSVCSYLYRRKFILEELLWLDCFSLVKWKDKRLYLCLKA